MRRINIHHINIVLFIIIAALMSAYRHELRWSMKELSEYESGGIPTPMERTLYREARELIRNNEELPRARFLLDRSLSIDPNCEAAYWLAACLMKMENYPEAAAQFERYIEIDPVIVDSYINAAAIYGALKQKDKARQVLDKGIAYFSKNVERYQPKLDQTVGKRYNEKATAVYTEYQASLKTLKEARVRLDEKP